MPENRASQKLTGNTISPGMGEGHVFVYEDVLKRFDEFYEIDDAQVEREVKELERALTKISDDLTDLAGRVEKEIDAELSAVFHAHLAMVRDPVLREEIEKEIREELVSAGSAVKNVFRRWGRRFQSMDAEVANQKSDDMRDLARRIVSALAGVHAHALEELPDGTVLVANRLLPSDTVFLARNTAAAALLEFGGKGSHAALFAREIGLPCIAGIPDLLQKVARNDYVVVDGDRALALINPTDEQREAFRDKAKRIAVANTKARKHAHEPAVSRDGKRIAVLANVGDAAGTTFAVDNGADGVGLYRTEKIYLGRQVPPSTTELAAEMAKTLAPAKGMPVHVRLLDLGGDKSLPFLESPKESNPALGLRGVRFLLQYPDLLETQLDALLKLSRDHDLHILVPMVTLPGDMLAMRKALAEAETRAKTPVSVKLGAMIETPAAALAAGKIMEFADFLSFGTNDLTQYSFAADRESAAVDEYFNDTDDVVFRLIRIVNSDVPSAPLSICGELADRPQYTSRLLQCGITTLSVVPPGIPEIKEAVRQSGHEFTTD